MLKNVCNKCIEVSNFWTSSWLTWSCLWFRFSCPRASLWMYSFFIKSCQCFCRSCSCCDVYILEGGIVVVGNDVGLGHWFLVRKQRNCKSIIVYYRNNCPDKMNFVLMTANDPIMEHWIVTGKTMSEIQVWERLNFVKVHVGFAQSEFPD